MCVSMFHSYLLEKALWALANEYVLTGARMGTLCTKRRRISTNQNAARTSVRASNALANMAADGSLSQL